jgi:signal transduction histidine kinase
VFAAFFFVALMFGMLRARGTELAVLGFASLACFALLTLVRYAGNGDAAMLRVDLLQIIVIAVTFPWLVFIGNRVKRLRDADRRKDDFLATLAHELRNPLAPIRTGIDILRTKEGVAKADAVLPMMDRQVGHLTRLLDDLLDVSRINRGLIELRRERVELARVLELAVEASRPHITEYRHQLTIGLPGNAVSLDGDLTRLSQVFINLLTNAAKYTEPGGHIDVACVCQGHEVTITVADDGIGIPPDQLERVFDMFAQVEGALTRSRGGLGIGLSLVKHVVELHGGRVSARSGGLGKGSTFTVTLPLPD